MCSVNVYPRIYRWFFFSSLQSNDFYSLCLCVHMRTINHLFQVPARLHSLLSHEQELILYSSNKNIFKFLTTHYLSSKDWKAVYSLNEKECAPSLLLTSAQLDVFNVLPHHIDLCEQCLFWNTSETRSNDRLGNHRRACSVVAEDKYEQGGANVHHCMKDLTQWSKWFRNQFVCRWFHFVLIYTLPTFFHF